MTPRHFIITAAALAAAGCAALPQARIDPPPALAAIAPERIQGLGGQRQGSLVLAGLSGRYERSAERLSLFERLGRDSASVTLATDDGQGRQISMRCRGAQRDITIGTVQTEVRRWRYGCDVSGAVQGRLELQGENGGALGAQAQRRGEWHAGGVKLELRSLHRWAGSALPSAEPVGYVVLDGAREVGLLELNGPAPRLWRPAAGDALREPVTHALLALALVWDPA